MNPTYGVSLAFAREVWSAVDQIGEPTGAAWVARLLNRPAPSVRRALARLEAAGNVRSYDPSRQRCRLFIAWVRP